MMGDALARHDEILRDAVAGHGGAIVKTTGDGLHAAFTSARAGVDAALDAQRVLGDTEWATPTPLLVRMGLNTGEAELRDGDYYGQSVNRAARIMAAAHGGQVAISQTTAQLLGGLPAARGEPRRPRGAPAARPRPARARVPGPAPGPPVGVPAPALARRVPHQPARAADELRRTRGGRRRGGRAAPGAPRGHHHRRGRGGQEPPGRAGGGPDPPPLPRRRLALRAGLGHRRAGGRRQHRRSRGGAGRLRPRPRGPPVVPPEPQGAPHHRQLRAPARSGDRARRRRACPLPAGGGARHEPRGARRSRRADLRAQHAAAPGRRRCEGDPGVVGRAAVRGARPRRPPRLRPRRRQRCRRRTDLQPPRRDPARDRAGRGAGAEPHARPDPRPARRAVPAPHGRDEGTGTAPDPAGDAHLVDRPARAGRAAGVRRPLRVRRPVRHRVRGGGHRRRRVGAPRRVGGEVAHARRGDPRRDAVPDARDGARVRRGDAGRVRRRR